ncbi:MAG: glycosyltransferase family 4 protein [Nitrososphaeraceae archaeon]
MTCAIKLLTFAGFIKGLSAPTLESQYFDEYVKLSKYVDDVTVISAQVSDLNEIPKNLHIEKPPISQIPKIRGLSKLFYYSIYPLKMRKKINLIYVRTMSPAEILSLWLAKSFLKIPCVLMIGGTCIYEPLTLRNRIYRWIFARALDAADKVIVYSDKMIPFIKKLNYSIDNEKFVVIRNAVDENRFRSIPPDEKILKNMGIKDEEKVILFVGKVMKRKGAIDILKMVPLVRKEYNIKIVFIGEVDEKSSDFFELNSLIESLNLKDRVILQGKIPNNDLVKYLVCADVYIYLTKGCEGIPRSILEAMACGKPVIATPIAGIPDAVISEETGYIVKDYVEAAEKINLLLADKNLYNKISMNCRNKILGEFTFEKTLPKMIKLFNSLMQNKIDH